MTDSSPRKQPNPRPCPAIILCGGRSRRMGRNKAFLPLGSQTVLQRVQQCFAGIARPLTLVIGRHAVPPPNTEFDHVIRDENPDYGPLEGLRVGLRSVAHDHDLAMIGTCDAPLVVPRVYLYLLGQLNRHEACDVVMPVIAGRHYPLTAVYRTRVLDEIESMVAQRELRVRDLLPRLRVLEVTADDLGQLDPQLNTVRNINTREEYESLLRDLQ